MMDKVKKSENISTPENKSVIKLTLNSVDGNSSIFFSLVFVFISKFKLLLILVNQTPTPTQLIRNCEEFGLCNPFEQTFQQAIDSKNSSNGLLATESSEIVENKCHDEDTLNTPIFGSTELDKKKVITQDSHAEKQTVVYKKETIARRSYYRKRNFSILQETSSNEVPQTVFRKIFPKSILNFSSTKKTNGIVSHTENKLKTIRIKKNTFTDSDANERNREAAKRYRNKQKLIHDAVLERNAQLEAENTLLRQELQSFRKFHANCSQTNTQFQYQFHSHI